MSSLSSAPFIRILPAFCIGIFFSFLEPVGFNAVIILFLTGVSGLFYLYQQKNNDFAFRMSAGIFLQLIYFGCGYVLTEIKDDRKSEMHFSNYDKADLYTAELIESPVERSSNLRAVINILSVTKTGKYSPSKGKCYIYFKGDSGASALMPGDKIIFSNFPVDIRPPANPGQFDFKRYASLKRIHHQVFLRKGEWQKIDNASIYNLKYQSVLLRDRFLSVYKSAGITGQEYAVLSALVLGYDDDIDSTIRDAFSASGTLHILSVSGMHVGIVFTALTLLFKVFERRRTTRLVRFIILLTALWFYAMITGLSSSVIRSAMMFSFILIGSSLNRSLNIYNSLSLSAFFILILFDPLMLFDVGLQLSFLAVAGIAYIYPKIYKTMFFSNYVLDKIWALISVSIAAQAATFSLSIYYFHQFPNYFIPANLIIIPLSTAGIFGGIFLLFISPFEFIFMKAGWIIHQLIHFLNITAGWFEKLPGSVWDEISINFSEFILIYALLITLIVFIESRSLKSLYLLQLFTIMFLVSVIFDSYRKHQHKGVIFYSGTDSFNCQIVKGDATWLVYTKSDSAETFKYSDNYSLSTGLPLNKRISVCRDSLSVPLKIENILLAKQYLSIGNYFVLILEEDKIRLKDSSILKADLIYTNNYAGLNISDQFMKADEVVVNESRYFRKKSNEGNKFSGKIHYLRNEARIIEL